MSQITVTAGVHGQAACIPNPVASNGTTDCTLTPDIGYHTSNVAVDGTPIFSNPGDPGVNTSYGLYTFNNVTIHHTLDAAFAINQYLVTAAAGADGALDGTTPSPATVNHGGIAGFLFNAAANYHVASVTSTCGSTAYSNSSNAVTTYTYTTDPVTGNCAVTATFAINRYTVTAAAGANGSLDGTTPSPATVNHGGTDQLPIQRRHRITTWPRSPPPAVRPPTATPPTRVTTYTYTTDPVTGDCAVTATFAINRYTVTATAGANGSLDGTTPSPATVNHGGTAELPIQRRRRIPRGLGRFHLRVDHLQQLLQRGDHLYLHHRSGHRRLRRHRHLRH